MDSKKVEASPEKKTDVSMRSPEGAATYLLLIGDQLAAKVINYLSPSEIRALSKVVDSQKNWRQAELALLLHQFNTEFLSSGPLVGDYQRQMQETLRKALSKDQARCLLTPMQAAAEGEPLKGLHLMDPELLVGMIKDEPLQFKAAVLACLQPDQAAEAFSLLPKDQSREILDRVATLSKLSKPTLDTIVQLIENFLDEQSTDDYLPLAGEQQVADILNNCDPEHRDTLLKSIYMEDEELGQRIEAQMLIFEHLVNLTDDGLRRLVGKVNQTELAFALKGSSEDLKEKVFGSMTKRAASFLKEDMENSGPVPMSRVTEARKAVVLEMDTMLKASEIEMRNPADDMVE